MVSSNAAKDLVLRSKIIDMLKLNLRPSDNQGVKNQSAPSDDKAAKWTSTPTNHHDAKATAENLR